MKSSEIYVVITSINAPTKAVFEIAKLQDRSLVVVGDKKTPSDWECEGVAFLSSDEQGRLKGGLSSWLPWNHYARKLLGYLYAIERGARVVIDTDDDNIPKPNWAFPDFEGKFDGVTSPGAFLNIYRYFSRQRIWPRGYPLQDVLASFQDDWEAVDACQRTIGVWQGLADDDPDVDAIYRLTVGEACKFEDKPPVVIAEGKTVPYNSQNTATRYELLPLLYLPAKVTFRFTDILRGLVAQPYMWKHGYGLGFCAAGVYQERNVHNLLKDFESEIPCYLHPYDVVRLCCEAAESHGDSVTEYLKNAYQRLIAEQLVPADELCGVEHWISDLAAAGWSA